MIALREYELSIVIERTDFASDVFRLIEEGALSCALKRVRFGGITVTQKKAMHVEEQGIVPMEGPISSSHVSPILAAVSAMENEDASEVHIPYFVCDLWRGKERFIAEMPAVMGAKPVIYDATGVEVLPDEDWANEKAAKESRFLRLCALLAIPGLVAVIFGGPSFMRSLGNSSALIAPLIALGAGVIYLLVLAAVLLIHRYGDAWRKRRYLRRLKRSQ